MNTHVEQMLTLYDNHHGFLKKGMRHYKYSSGSPVTYSGGFMCFPCPCIYKLILHGYIHMVFHFNCTSMFHYMNTPQFNYFIPFG